MIFVYVVRQFFDGCSDTEYTGVYTDFWKAADAVIKDQEESFEDDGLEFHLPNQFTPDDQLWIDVISGGLTQGIYYTIDKLELK